MTENDRTTLVILGAGGDLTERLLLPGLAQVLTIEPQHDVTLIGASYDAVADWPERVRTAFASAPGAGGPAVERTAASTRYVQTDATSSDSLGALLEGVEGQDGRIILYFALPQAITEKALAALAQVRRPAGLMLALEKPIGTDEAAARATNAAALALVPEHNVFRVDHFLGMPAVQDLVGLRLANRIIEPLLARDHVERVEIVFNETLGLEGRAAFYEKTGAIRDMLQSHLLQVMGVLLMTPPASLSDDEIPHLIEHVLAHTSLAGPPSQSVVAGRYTAGTVDGRTMPSYVDEHGVNPDGRVETYARLSLNVDTWRWSGVPVVVESGKAIGSPRQEVAVHFRQAPHKYEGMGDVPANCLRLRFEDGEVVLELNAGSPADWDGLTRLTLTSRVGSTVLSAYGSVVRWLLRDNPAFSVAPRGAEYGWHIVQPALDAIADGTVPIQDYQAGTENPLR